MNRQTTSLTQQDYGQNLASQFGIPGVNQSPQTSGLPNLRVTGLFDLGGSLLTPLRLDVTDWNFSEKADVDQRPPFPAISASTASMSWGAPATWYTGAAITRSSTSQPAPLIGPAGGNAFASFLLGAPYQILRDEFPPGMVELITPRNGFYAQDDFKASRRLTLNLGARYDIMPYAREKYNRLSNFDPATGTMLIAGQNTSPRLRNTDYKDIAPRVGLAYALGADYKTVIRAGYGIGYHRSRGRGRGFK